MRLGHPLPRSRFPAALAIVICVGALALLVVVIANGAVATSGVAP
jgi:hypothetical protein